MDILSGEAARDAANQEQQKKAFTQFVSENQTSLVGLGIDLKGFVDTRTLQEVVKKAKDPESMSDSEAVMFKKVKDILPTDILPPAAEGAIQQDIAA